jgi:hypothetical protein
MVPALGRGDFLLDKSHKLLALCQSQTQISDVAQIIGAVERQHVDASARPIDSDFHQTHPILDPQPVKNSAGHTLPATAPPSLDSPLAG